MISIPQNELEDMTDQLYKALHLIEEGVDSAGEPGESINMLAVGSYIGKSASLIEMIADKLGDIIASYKKTKEGFDHNYIRKGNTTYSCGTVGGCTPATDINTEPR